MRQREALKSERLSISAILNNLARVEKSLHENWKVLSSEQVSALRLSADISFNKLKKVMPDLRSIEVKEVGDGDFLFRFRMAGEDVSDDEFHDET